MNPLVVVSIICSIFVLVQASSSSLTPYAYWRKVFPNTPMPDDIKALLPSERFSEQEPGDNKILQFPPRNRRAYFGLWTADIGVSESDDEHPLAFPEHEQSKYKTKHFFLERNLEPGCEMNFTILNNRYQRSGSVFLPREESQAIPFSSTKLDTILRKFSIDAGSEDAFIIKETLLACERPPIKGETKRCATSLESMIHFVISKLGNNDVRVLSRSIANKYLMNDTNIVDGVYRVRVSGVKMISKKAVVCHEMVYPYAVFYCHNLPNTKSYMVSLINDRDDGPKRMNAIALCHHDTRHWNPGHASFQMLGLKPGSNVAICHFLDEGLAWVPKH